MNSELWNPAGLWRTLAQISRGPLATAGLQSLAVQVAAIVLGLVQAVALARLLGATDYGIFATATSVTAVLAAIAVGGFDQYAVRELSRLRADNDLPTALTFLRFGNRAALAASLLASVGLALVAGAYAGAESDWRNTFMLAAAATPFATLLLLRAGQLRGLGAVVIAQVPVAIVRPGATILLLVTFWMAGLSMAAPQGMTAWTLGSVASFAVATAALRPLATALTGSGAAPALSRKWLVDATPFLGTTAVAIISAQVNTLMLAALAGAEAAGLFQPVVFLVPLIALPLTALSMPFAPHIVDLWKQGELRSLERASLLFSATTLVGALLIGLTALLLAEQVLGIFGSEFVAAMPALPWLVAAQIIFVALGPAALLLSMTGAHNLVLLSHVLGLLANICVAVLTIPAYGLEGAAIAFAAAIVIAKSAALLFALRRFGFDPSIVGACRAILHQRRL